MSIEATRTRTADSIDKYDHEIQLIDGTISETENPQFSSSGSWRRLARNPTRTSLKHQLSSRKYAKWQQDKLDPQSDDRPTVEAEENGKGESSNIVAESHPQNEESSTVDFAGQPKDVPQEVDKKKNLARKRDDTKPETAIDILYENQRGSFFCGLPLYSHSSLLPFDPSAWITHEFKDSPVNITNAQVPDPSWMWAWKTWYVDMSHDVDEEGWQYSFSFGNGFAWHGTHPWFHSFVRRRRWLRKRVKRVDYVGSKEKEGTLEAAHHLNTDYFTIHSKPRDRSPASASNPETALPRPASYSSFQSIQEDLEDPDDIKDIPNLMKSIHKAKIDREKVDVVKLFVREGGDELFYLSDKIPEIMETLVFQNSRRQILEFLKVSAEKAQQHRDEHDADDRPEARSEKQRIDNILKAAEAADHQIHGLEYWSDRKHVLQTEDDSAEGSEDGGAAHESRRQSDVIGEIKGISEKSETTQEIRVDRRLMDKGKQPERSTSRSEDNDSDDRDAGPRLGRDSVLIPDDDAEPDRKESG